MPQSPKFTPGPLEVSQRDGFTDLVARIPNGFGTRTIATVRYPEDARLFAASPKMYEALEAMVKGRVSENLHNAVHPSGRFCHVCGCNSPVTVHSHGCPVKLAEDALAAARGEA